MQFYMYIHMLYVQYNGELFPSPIIVIFLRVSSKKKTLDFGCRTRAKLVLSMYGSFPCMSTSKSGCL